MSETKSPRGTAAMSPEVRKEVARKGGQAVAKNRAHMAEIGRKGGRSVSKNREHMSKIGRKGGSAGRTAVESPVTPGLNDALKTAFTGPDTEGGNNEAA